MDRIWNLSTCCPCRRALANSFESIIPGLQSEESTVAGSQVNAVLMLLHNKHLEQPQDTRQHRYSLTTEGLSVAAPRIHTNTTIRCCYGDKLLVRSLRVSVIVIVNRGNTLCRFVIGCVINYRAFSGLFFIYYFKL